MSVARFDWERGSGSDMANGNPLYAWASSTYADVRIGPTYADSAMMPTRVRWTAHCRAIDKISRHPTTAHDRERSLSLAASAPHAPPAVDISFGVERRLRHDAKRPTYL